MNAGWITVAANIMPSSMVMVITKIGDGGNVGMQIAALTSAFIVAIVVFLPMFSLRMCLKQGPKVLSTDSS